MYVPVWVFVAVILYVVAGQTILELGAWLFWQVCRGVWALLRVLFSVPGLLLALAVCIAAGWGAAAKDQDTLFCVGAVPGVILFLRLIALAQRLEDARKVRAGATADPAEAPPPEPSPSLPPPAP